MRSKEAFLSALMKTLCGLLVLLAIHEPAWGIPAFARKYTMSCKTCHAVAYPALNPFGMMFKKNGYQMPLGAEEPSLQATAKRPDKHLILFEHFPLALRIKSMVTVQRHGETGKTSLEFVTPNSVDMLSGGSIFPNVSYFINFGIFTNGQIEAPELAFVQFHNIGGDGMANVRLGQFNLLDFQFPNHRNITTSTSKYGTYTVGDSPFTLDTHHIGVDVYGQPGWGNIFYEVAVINGANAHGEMGGEGGGHGAAVATDLDRFKDIYARLAYTLPDRKRRFGLFAYLGKTEFMPEAGGHVDKSEIPGAVAVQDKFNIVGADMELFVGPLILSATATVRNHQNPHGDGDPVSSQAAMIQGSYMLRRNLLALLRYDIVLSSDDATLEQKILTPYLTYLMLDNVRFSLEAPLNLNDLEDFQTFFVVDMAL